MNFISKVSHMGCLFYGEEILFSVSSDAFQQNVS